MHQISKCLSLLLLLILSLSVEADQHCTQWLAEVISIQGKVDIKYAGNSNWQTVSVKQKFCHGDKIRTGKYSRVTLLFEGDSRATLDQNSTLVFQAPEKEANSWYLKLLQGSGFFRSRQPQRLNIQTPFINAVHQGTEFLVTVTSTQAEISVFDGQVAGISPFGEIQIDKGYIGIAVKGQPPLVKALTIRPEDAVQWTLYYPPIIDYQSSESTLAGFQPAIDAYQQGNIVQALKLLESTPVEQQNVNYLILKSSLLLSVGSVDGAIKQLDKVLLLDGNNSLAFALQSIISVTKNRQDKAYHLAHKAIKLNPKSAVAYIALSYAYQSQFKIELALKSTQEALRLSPDNALAWARLAELQLSTGERSDAMESAKKAQALNPKLDRTLTVLGFAYLAQIDIDQAKASFTEAIKLNTADPLARLGLGLAKIRKGDIEEGTRDLETAVSLDPDNAIMRSYLGKAYYELKNESFAATELAIAKEKDPNDPTPWFYDAIRKQTTNRPIEALHDMQKAIELNDNRGVYRSKLLLDDDLAARSASLGRIYNDLGFQQTGLVEGWKSVNENPTNYSAHRLLADNYSALRRHEIARVSELLQSQLLQPINNTPIQPQLGEANLFIASGAGPSEVSFNEFNPLFSRNHLALQASGLAGTQNTHGDEVTQSGIWNQLSYSLGQLHYETDGYKKNNDLEHNIYNAFVQASITPDFSIQAEYRHNETKNGDLTVNFDPSDSDESFRRILRTNTARIGLRASPAKHSTFIVSGLYQLEKEHTEFDFFGFNSASDVKNRGYLIEAQYLFHYPQFNANVGGGYFSSTNEKLIPFFGVDDKIDVQHSNAYFYSNTNIFSKLTWTLGLSFDSLQDKTVGGRVESLNPKVGLMWDVSPNTILRFAAFRTLKRSLLNDQTIEPTQVAGFNQFFDDFLGTRSTRYGIALDHKFTQDFFMGVEASYRKLVVRFPFFGKDKWSEQLYRAYFNWTLSSNSAMNFEYRFEKFYRNKKGSFDDFYPKTETHLVPLTLNFFHPSGFTSKLGVTYVHQKVDFFTESASGYDDFFLFDMGIGFRLPKRYGVINLAVKNLFNQNFRFQGDHARTIKDVAPLFLPERSISGQITLGF